MNTKGNGAKWAKLNTRGKILWCNNPRLEKKKYIYIFGELFLVVNDSENRRGAESRVESRARNFQTQIYLGVNLLLGSFVCL